MSTMSPITEFRGPYRFLSNFWPCAVQYGSLTYACAEGAYQAQKSFDYETQLYFVHEDGLGAKKRGARLATIRPDWPQVRLDIMRAVVEAKFRQNWVLREWLLQTGDALLIEGNHWGDTYWGVYRGKGANNLGRILMNTRTALRKES